MPALQEDPPGKLIYLHGIRGAEDEILTLKRKVPIALFCFHCCWWGFLAQALTVFDDHLGDRNQIFLSPHVYVYVCFCFIFKDIQHHIKGSLIKEGRGERTLQRAGISPQVTLLIMGGNNAILEAGFVPFVFWFTPPLYPKGKGRGPER